MKLTVFILSLLILVDPLMGQTKIDEPNYGYELLPLDHQRPITGNYYRSDARLAKIAEMPVVVDYTNLMTRVKDQGRASTCMAFSVTYALGFLNNQKYGYSLEHEYSQSLIYNLAVNSRKYGLILPQIFSVLSEVGYVSARLFPYTLDYDYYDPSILPSLEVLETAIKNRITDWSWFYVGDTRPNPDRHGDPISIPGYQGVNRARELLAAGKTVVLDMPLTDGFGNGMKKENWIYSQAVFGSWSFRGWHSLCVAGYNDTLMTKDGRGAFLVINSWGYNVFNDGYCLITYKMLAEKCYDGEFYTFSLRENYQPRLMVTLDLRDFGGFYNLSSGLKEGNNTYRQALWEYRWYNYNQYFLNEAVIDLTDISDGLTLDGKNTFFIEGYLSVSSLGSNKPTIKGIHITDQSRGIDAHLACNIVVENSLFHVEWIFDNSLIALARLPIPTEYGLAQNYPNPFRSTTTINFSLPKSGFVSLRIYNLLGQEVAVLVNGELKAGAYNIECDAGRLNLACGIHVYVLKTPDYTASKKLVFVK